jgi:uncharacterized membrane protein
MSELQPFDPPGANTSPAPKGAEPNRRGQQPPSSDCAAVGQGVEEADPVDDGFEDSFRATHPWLWLATLIGPIVTTISLLAAVYLYDHDHFRNLLAAALATFFFLGRFVILLGDASQGQSQLFYAWELTAMVFYMDLVVAVLLSFHLSLVFRVPRLGARLRILEADGRFVLSENPWMRRATFLGVVAFVMFPLAATGSVGGSIFGRLLGMSRVQTLVGVATGSAIGCGVMYFGATFINQLFDGYPIAKYVGGGAFLLAFVWVLNKRYKHLKMRRQGHMTSQSPHVGGPRP